MHFAEAGGWIDTAVYDRSQLHRGAAFSGPAIVEQADSTTVVPPGAEATVDAFGNLIVDVRGMPRLEGGSDDDERPGDDRPDHLHRARNGFRAMCSQGSALVERVAWGPVITQGRDYSVGLLTGDGRLVGHGTVDITPHMGTFEFSVNACREDFGDEMEPGDVFIVNDPYRGGTHNQDVRLVRPVFLDGQIFAYAAACGHWSDMGGPIPGRSIRRRPRRRAEGIVIPPTRLYQRDKPVNSTFEFIRDECARTARADGRRRRAVPGDEAARAAGCSIRRSGTARTRCAQAFEAVMDYSERLFRQEIAELPDGEYVFNDFCDHDIGRDGHPRVKFTCRLTVEADRATIDWTDSDDAPIGPAGPDAACPLECDVRRHAALLPAPRAAEPRDHPGARDQDSSRAPPRMSSTRRRSPATAPRATRSATPR